ncbi:BspA family leucine-rich repeat surface protein [Xylocopilactobacillus apis]
MNYMFYRCNSLDGLDLSSFDTSNVETMQEMFADCSTLSKLNITNFDTSKVQNVANIISLCTSLTELDLSNFDTSRVTSVEDFLAYSYNIHHLVLGPKTYMFGSYPYDGFIPDVPAVGTKILGTSKLVKSSNWIVTNGYEKGKKYLSSELMGMRYRDQVTTYDWDAEPDNTIETKVVTRTINVNNPDYTVKTEKQSATIQRTVTNNPDGSKTYGEWSKAQWEEYNVPKILGYEPTQSLVPAQSVDGNTQDSTIDIYYDPMELTITVQYINNGKVVGSQRYVGYIGDTLTPRYLVPRGYVLDGIPPKTVTFDGGDNQIIKVNVKPR